MTQLRANVINVSAPHYNVGAAKLADWLRSQGYQVAEQSLGEADLVCLSVIFSWDCLTAVKIAQDFKGRAEVWAGGPGLFGDRKNGFKLRGWWKEQTGVDAHVGLDWRFERQRGDYRMAFASRGCPENCHFCNVTPMEGKEFTLDENFQLAPILCDNNLSALPENFQDYIVSRYFVHGKRLLDCNSGFEPRTFTEETYWRWRPVMRGPWRFGFDYMPEVGNVRRMMHILRDEPSKKKRVYVLIGNEPFDFCYQRAMSVVEWGGEPHCQPILMQDAMSRRDFIIQHDWTAEKLVHFTRYFNKFFWKPRRDGTRVPLSEYECGTLRPFRGDRSLP